MKITDKQIDNWAPVAMILAIALAAILVANHNPPLEKIEEKPVQIATFGNTNCIFSADGQSVVCQGIRFVREK